MGYKRTVPPDLQLSTTKIYEIYRHRAKRAVQRDRMTEKEYRDFIRNLHDVWDDMILKDDERRKVFRIAKTLQEAFVWSITAQGFGYWDYINDLLSPRRSFP